MIKAEVPWLQRNDLTRLDYDASNKVHKFPFRFIYDMGELMGVGGGEG